MDSSFMKLLDGTTPRTVLRSTLKHLDPVPTPMVLRNHGKRKKTQIKQQTKPAKQRKPDAAKFSKDEGASLSEGKAQVSQTSSRPAPEELRDTSSFRVVDQTYANITSTQDDSDINESIDLKAASRFQRKKDSNPLSQDRFTGGDREPLNFSGAPGESGSLHLSHSNGPNQTYADITSTQENDSVSDGSVNLEDASRFRRKKNPIMFSSLDTDLNISKGAGVENEAANISKRRADITYGNITSTQEDSSISDGSINIEDAGKFKKKKEPIAFSSIETDLMSGIFSSQETQSSEGSINMEDADKFRTKKTPIKFSSLETDLNILNAASSQDTQLSEGVGLKSEAANISRRGADLTYGNITSTQEDNSISDGSINIEDAGKFKKKKDPIAFSSLQTDLMSGITSSQGTQSSEGSIDMEDAGNFRTKKTPVTFSSLETDLNTLNTTSSQDSQPSEDGSGTGLRRGLKPEVALPSNTSPHTSHNTETDQTYGSISLPQGDSTISDGSIDIEHAEIFKKKRDRIAFSSVDVDLNISNHTALKGVHSENSGEKLLRRISSRLSQDWSLNTSRADHAHSSGNANNVTGNSTVSSPKSKPETMYSPKEGEKASPSTQASMSSVKTLSPYKEVSKKRLEVSLVDVIKESPKKRSNLDALVNKATQSLELNHQQLQDLTQEILKKERKDVSQDTSFNSISLKSVPKEPSINEELKHKHRLQTDKSSQLDSTPSTGDSQASSGAEMEEFEKDTNRVSENDVDAADDSKASSDADNEVISSTSDEGNIQDAETVIGLVSSFQNQKLAERQIKLIPEIQEAPLLQPEFEGSQGLVIPKTQDGLHQERVKDSQTGVVPEIHERSLVASQTQGLPLGGPVVAPIPLAESVAVPEPHTGSEIVAEPQTDPLVVPEPQTGPLVVPKPQPGALVAQEPQEGPGVMLGTQKPMAVPEIKERSLVVPEPLEGQFNNLGSLEGAGDSIPPPLGFRDEDMKGLSSPVMLDVKSAITNSDLLESIINDFSTVPEPENGTVFDEKETRRDVNNRTDNLDLLPFRVIEFDGGKSGMREKMDESADQFAPEFKSTNDANHTSYPVGTVETSVLDAGKRDPSSDEVQGKAVLANIPLESHETIDAHAPNLIPSVKEMSMSHDTQSTESPWKNLKVSPMGNLGEKDNHGTKSWTPKKGLHHKPWTPKRKTLRDKTPTQIPPKRGKRGEADTSNNATPQKPGKANIPNITTPQRRSKQEITSHLATPKSGRPRKEDTPKTVSAKKRKPTKEITPVSASQKIERRRGKSMPTSESSQGRMGSRKEIFAKRDLVIEAEVHAPADLFEDESLVSGSSQKSDIKEITPLSPTSEVSESTLVSESISTGNVPPRKVETVETTPTNTLGVHGTGTLEKGADSTFTQGQSLVVASGVPSDDVPEDIDMESRETEMVKITKSKDGNSNQESWTEPHLKEPRSKEVGLEHGVGSTQTKPSIVNEKNVGSRSSKSGSGLESSYLASDEDDSVVGELTFGLDKQNHDINQVELDSVTEKPQLRESRDAKSMNKYENQSVLRRPDTSAESGSRGRTTEKGLKQLTMREFLENLSKAPHPAPRKAPTVQDLMKVNLTKQKPVLKLSKTTQKVKQAPRKTFSAAATKEVLSHFARGHVRKETVEAALEVSEQFFANMFYDLQALVSLRKRKKILMKDMEKLMKRLNLTTSKQSLYALMEDYLPVDVWSKVIPVAYADNRIIPESSGGYY